MTLTTRSRKAYRLAATTILHDGSTADSCNERNRLVVEEALVDKVSTTRSGRNYGYKRNENPSEEVEVEEVETVVLDLDSEPFFQRALDNDSKLGDEDRDDTEGRPLSVVPSPAPSSSPSLESTAKTPKTRKAKSKDRRRAQAAKKALLFPKLPPKYRPRLAILRLCSAITHTLSNLCSEDLPSAAGGWVGKRIAVSHLSSVDLQELKERGLKELHWDGKIPRTFVDKKGRIMVVLAGKPTEADWDKIVEEASSLMTDMRNLGVETGVLKSSQMAHRRGSFWALPAGVSFGGGSKRPGNLSHTVGEKAILAKLQAHRSIRRIVGFQHASFALYAPKLYEHYRKTLAKLYAHEPHLEPNFPSISPFPAMTYNLGPSTATVEHTDAANVAYGWCCITALGKYNPEKEGHLILYDLGIIITFPPGCTVLIPSAVFRHANTPLVEEGSFRQSITQYCSGGLFRWTRYGFRTAKALAAINPEMKKEADGNLRAKTEEALSLFSTVDSLEQDRMNVLRT